jgi:hypothetical protein
LDYWIFNFPQFAIDWKNNSKTEVEKVLFFIFMYSYAEMSFLKDKSLNMVPTFFFVNIGRYGVKKICNFTLISKLGFIFVSTSYQKLRVKNPDLLGTSLKN